jgi:hypothetical protein
MQRGGDGNWHERLADRRPRPAALHAHDEVGSLGNIVVQKRLLRAQTNSRAAGDCVLGIGCADLHGAEAAAVTVIEGFRKQK